MKNLIRSLRRDIYLHGEEPLTNARLLQLILTSEEMRIAEQYRKNKIEQQITAECCNPNG